MHATRARRTDHLLPARSPCTPPHPAPHTQVRVFHRAVHMGKEIVPVGGIGEVATDPAYRGRGLARALMNDGCEYMDHSGNVTYALSSLSAAEGVEKFYGSYGYKPVRIRYTKLSVPMSVEPALPASPSAALPSGQAGAEGPVAQRIRAVGRAMAPSVSESAHGARVYRVAMRPSGADGSPEVDLRISKIDIPACVFELGTLYGQYAENFHGILARSQATWNQYVPHVLKEGIWGAWAHSATGPQLVAYIGIAEKRGTVKLAEYGAAPAWQDHADLFNTLLRVAVNNHTGAVAAADGKSMVEVVAPMAPLTLLAGMSATADESLTDNAWMYRIVPGQEHAPVTPPAKPLKRLAPWQYLPALRTAAEQDKHVIWFTDAF